MPNVGAQDVIPGSTEYAAKLQVAAAMDDYTHLLDDSRPARAPKPKPEMSELAKELVARTKETFFAYVNRTDRSKQTTLGPSQIGTPCDRRLAMHLMGCKPVNPGGDSWASFLGTCGHAGVADMFDWANAGTGRYVTEMPLTFQSELVPKGTGDLLDRMLKVFVDHKMMGSFSLNKLKSEGPSETYRVQLHTYAMGAEDQGEEIEHVALIAWPRQNGTLQSMYAWTEPYDRGIAERALARVERIRERLDELGGPDGCPASEVPAQFPIADDCTFCSFYKPNAKSLEFGGCNGKD